ncbi:TetR/AcrR family transcriptional regulator [Bacillus sp. AGMB 02131]|uniref:TetR/AcrR family transcriptional regulator n=1 Tax=Peribacillus faecalis TaxID=2772559 RepID=A0A927CZ49_9BACI|nr:TetR/AcrR family transcriptional regulator [Peribacillus faecalis]MBD3107999.1 TetR/AcrR family transcriptional regulator [Peribacillus faecalis]
MKKERNSANAFAKDCIATAFFKLMKEKEYEDITITDIAKKAGVSRVTYYRNYNSKEDIITQYMDELGYQFEEQTKHLNIIKDTRTFIVSFFQHWLKHEEFLLSLLQANRTNIMLEHINKSIKKNTTTAMQKYEACHYLGSIHNILFEWIKGGKKESPEEMADIICMLYQSPLTPSLIEKRL